MPETVRRRSVGPQVSTGRGITASGDKRTNVRWSAVELAAVEAGARAAGQPSAAAYVREVTLRACGYMAPEQPKVTGPIPWEVAEPGDVVANDAPEIPVETSAAVAGEEPPPMGEETSEPPSEPHRATRKRSKKRKPSPRKKRTPPTDGDLTPRPVWLGPDGRQTAESRGMGGAFRGLLRSIAAKVLG